VRVGVIGLGPLWRTRYRPTLVVLRDRFEVVALCDEIEERARREAKEWGCAAAAGPTQLLENPEVEAALLLDPQWHRLWPVKAACRLGKPLFCCGGLDLDDAHADALYRELRDQRLPFMLETAPRRAPALRLLKEVLDSLGPARVVLCDLAESRHLHPRDPTGPGIQAALLSCCRFLLPAEPIRVLARENDPGGFAGWQIELSDNRTIQITRYRSPLARSQLRFHVVAEKGTASAELPARLRWTDALGVHTRAVSGNGRAGTILLEQFFRVVREGAEPDPSLEEAYGLLTWVRAAARSLREGRPVEIREMEN
jgi:predicted dehydrogenase